MKRPVEHEEPSAERTDQSSANIFSDDEAEKKFIGEVSQARKETWKSSKMQWNTIHGIPWKRCNMVGEGTYGSVYLGRRQDKKLFAVKSINIAYPTTSKSFFNIHVQIAEIMVMKIMRSKYIVRCLGCGRSRGANGMKRRETLDVFLEYIARGSLRHVGKVRKKVFEETPYVRQYTYDVLKALQYMRKNEIVHGDIKLGNLLLSDDCVKLADWGGSKQLTPRNLPRILIGTRGFRSPEVLRREEQGYPSDIYSLGCTVIEMMTGKCPKQVVTMVPKLDPLKQQFTNVAEYRPRIPTKASPECKDFLEQCLRPNAPDRWTAAELLHHPFITKRDKTNTLPYDMPIPKRIHAGLLRPARRNDPDLPDEPITDRVYKHLAGAGLPGSWMRNLMGCRPDKSPLFPPSPSTGTTSRESSPSPAPLPPFSPEFVIGEDTNMGSDIAQALREEFGSSLSPQRAAIPIPTTEREVQDATDMFDPARAKELEDSIIRSLSLMEDLNDAIHQEAILAAAQQAPPESETDSPKKGFVQTIQQSSIESSIGSSSDRTPKTRGRLPTGCAGGKSVDAVNPAPKGQRKKK